MAHTDTLDLLWTYSWMTGVSDMTPHVAGLYHVTKEKNILFDVTVSKSITICGINLSAHKRREGNSNFETHSYPGNSSTPLFGQ